MLRAQLCHYLTFLWRSHEFYLQMLLKPLSLILGHFTRTGLNGDLFIHSPFSVLKGTFHFLVFCLYLRTFFPFSLFSSSSFFFFCLLKFHCFCTYQMAKVLNCSVPSVCTCCEARTRFYSLILYLVNVVNPTAQLSVFVNLQPLEVYIRLKSFSVELWIVSLYAELWFPLVKRGRRVSCVCALEKVPSGERFQCSGLLPQASAPSPRHA